MLLKHPLGPNLLANLTQVQECIYKHNASHKKKKKKRKKKVVIPKYKITTKKSLKSLLKKRSIPFEAINQEDNFFLHKFSTISSTLRHFIGTSYQAGFSAKVSISSWGIFFYILNLRSDDLLHVPKGSL